MLPPDWPKDARGQPIKEVFRSMREDFTDLQHEYHQAMSYRRDSDEMRDTVVRAVTQGSTERSPFVHTSTDIDCARRWARLSTNLRGKKDGLFCCIKILDMMLQGVLGKGDVINLSNDAAIRAYFPKKQFEYSQFVEDNFSDCYKFAVKSKEVLICWRGCLPLEFMCVIDDVTQANWGPLPTWVPDKFIPVRMPHQPYSAPPGTRVYQQVPPWRENSNQAADNVPELQPSPPALPPPAKKSSATVPPWRKQTNEADKHGLAHTEAVTVTTAEAAMPVEAVEPVDAGGSWQMTAESTQANGSGEYAAEHSEQDVDWGNGNDESLDEIIEALSQSDADDARECEVHPVFERIVEDIRAQRDELVWERHLPMLRSLEEVEHTYTRELQKIQDMFVSESLRATTVSGRRHLCIGGGFSVERQKSRHDLKRTIAWGDPRVKYAEAEISATKRHKVRLSQLADEFSRDFPDDTFADDMPLNPHSLNCLQEVNDGPRRETTEVNYLQILSGHGLVRAPPGHTGRKAGTTAIEEELTESEMSPWHDWVAWWLRIGNFSSVSDFDENGWSPCHHAVDAMTYSARARHVAIELARSTPVDVLESKTTGHQPPGWTVLHLLCDGSDLNFSKAAVVEILLERKVDMEARDPKGNTALLTAAATGMTDVCDVLLDHGADKDVSNYNDQGVWQKAHCSSTLPLHLLQRGCPKWWSDDTGRTRVGTGQGRLCRYAMTTSANSTYTSTSVAKRFIKAKVRKAKR